MADLVWAVRPGSDPPRPGAARPDLGSRRSSPPRGQTQERIFEAAMELFRTRYGETSITRHRRRGGDSRGVAVHHMPSKEELLSQLALETIKRVHDTLEEGAG